VPVITVSAKGQIVIPAELRKKHNIKRGDRFELQEIGNRLVLVPLPEKPFVRLYGTLKGKTSLTRSLQKEHARENEKEDR